MKVGDALLAVAAAIAVMEGLFAARAGRATVVVLGLVLLGVVMVVARLRLPPPWRARLAVVTGLALAGAFGVEIRLDRESPRDATVAARAGRAFDTRTPTEVARDLRAAGKRALPTPAVDPFVHVGDPGGGVDVDGATVLPLGGVSGATVVLCNESGSFTVYEADEHGFQNPRGLWNGGPIDIAVLGEGTMQGQCVPVGEGPVDVIRREHPRTLNVSYYGDGPLLELATLLEYLADVRPRVVVWTYFDKDLGRLDGEKHNPILRRYLDEPSYRQGLAGRQVAIDDALGRLADARVAEAPGSWPREAPGWLQDLLMGEDHTSAGAALRLDRLILPLSGRVLKKALTPDYALYEQILARAKATVASWGGSMVVVWIVDLHYLDGSIHPFRKGMLDVVRRLDLPLIDLQPVFNALPNPMNVRRYEHPLKVHSYAHLGPEGYQLFGQTVLARLSALGLRP